MSVIAWDGKTLAADRQATNSNLRRTVRKIWREGDTLLAGVGNAAPIQALRNWYMGGMDPGAFPEECRRDECAATLIIISKGGQVLKFENSPFPITYEDGTYADGCGRDFAYAAMAMGADARQAVEIACQFDVHCGQGVDTLNFDDV